MNVTIRTFRLEDLADVIELSKRAYGYQRERDHMADLKSLIDCCLTLYENNPAGAIVAEIDGRVVGTVFAYVSGDEEEGCLSWIGLDPDFQGKGVGSALMDQAEDYLAEKGVKRIRLGSDRPLAMSFYINRGYGLLDCNLLKRLDNDDQLESRRPDLMEIMEATETYASFRAKSNNQDQLIEHIEEAMAAGTDVLEALVQVAERYVMYPVTEKRARESRQRLEHALTHLGKPP